jgi:AhpC/TSA family
VAESNGQAQTAGGQGGATRLPLLNEPAPAFHARTTHGERDLEDYRGRWLIFFAHPADFTPVCASLRVPVERDHRFRWKMITQSGGT